MRKKKIEFRTHFEWDSYLQSDLKKMVAYLTRMVLILHTQKILAVLRNEEILEEFDELSHEQLFSLTDGGRLSIDIVTGPLPMLNQEGIRRISVILMSDKGIRQTLGSNRVYNYIWRIANKERDLKKASKFLFSAASNK